MKILKIMILGMFLASCNGQHESHWVDYKDMNENPLMDVLAKDKEGSFPFPVLFDVLIADTPQRTSDAVGDGVSDVYINNDLLEEGEVAVAYIGFRKTKDGLEREVDVFLSKDHFNKKDILTPGFSDRFNKLEQERNVCDVLKHARISYSKVKRFNVLAETRGVMR